MEIIQRQDRVRPADPFTGMGSLIPEGDNIFEQRKKFWGQDIPKAPVMDQTGEVVLIRDFQIPITTIHPPHRQLQRAPR